MAKTFRLKRRDGSVRNELTSAELRALAKVGKIHPDDCISKSDSDTWIPASKVKGLAIVSHKMLPCRSMPERQMQIATHADSAKTGWRQVVQQCRHYVPLIESSSGQGSGLLVSRNGFIVTNRHVIDGARNVLVSFYDGTKSKALVVHRHEEFDLAVLRCSIHTNNFFDLMIRIARDFDAGDEVIAIGHPHGLAFTSTRGIISEVSRKLSDGEFIQSDVAINPGNSGGPLLDSCGNLVGLNTQIHKGAQGLGFALPGSAVAEYLEHVETLVRLEELSIPTDEEIAALDDVMSPQEILEAALKSSELEHSIRTNDDGSVSWDVLTRSGYSFWALATDSFLLLYKYIDTLYSVHLSDATLLRNLLQWQDEMWLVRFAINEDHDLAMKVSRSTEDIDISEAQSAILEMARAIDEMYQPISDYMA